MRNKKKFRQVEQEITAVHLLAKLVDQSTQHLLRSVVVLKTVVGVALEVNEQAWLDGQPESVQNAISALQPQQPRLTIVNNTISDLHPSNSGKHWSATDNKTLINLRNQGKTFKQISKYMGRTHQACQKQFYRLTGRI